MYIVVWTWFRIDLGLTTKLSLQLRQLYCYQSIALLIVITTSFTENNKSMCLIDKANFLGISIVGQSGSRGDGGIHVGSVMKG